MYIIFMFMMGYGHYRKRWYDNHTREDVPVSQEITLGGEGGAVGLRNNIPNKEWEEIFRSSYVPAAVTDKTKILVQ